MNATQFRFTVCTAYTTVKGIAMFGKRYEACSQNETHVELWVPLTGERVVFTRSELM